MTLKTFTLGFVLTAFVVGSSTAQDAASVVLVEYGGKVCVGGTDVVWVVGRDKVMRWHQKDGAVSEIQLPDLNHIDMARGGIIGCLVRPDGEIDLYYEEYYNIPGTRAATLGFDENRRVQTIWLSGSRHRVLLDIEVPEGGYVEDTIRILPELGVTVHGLTVERVSDGLQYKVAAPDGAYLLGVWPASRNWPVDPPDILICYAYPPARVKAGGCVAVRIGSSSMEQRPLPVDPRDINLMNWEHIPVEAQYRCALKGPASRGYAWPNRAAFDCQSEQKSAVFAQYPVPTGWIDWRLAETGEICRQRHIGAEALTVQAQCFRPEGEELISMLPGKRGYRGLVGGYEYSSTSGWTMSIFSRIASRPIEGRLVPVND